MLEKTAVTSFSPSCIPRTALASAPLPTCTPAPSCCSRPTPTQVRAGEGAGCAAHPASSYSSSGVQHVLVGLFRLLVLEQAGDSLLGSRLLLSVMPQVAKCLVWSQWGTLGGEKLDPLDRTVPEWNPGKLLVCLFISSVLVCW